MTSINPAQSKQCSNAAEGHSLRQMSGYCVCHIMNMSLIQIMSPSIIILKYCIFYIFFQILRFYHPLFYSSVTCFCEFDKKSSLLHSLCFPKQINGDFNKRKSGILLVFDVAVSNSILFSPENPIMTHYCVIHTVEKPIPVDIILKSVCADNLTAGYNQ